MRSLAGLVIASVGLALGGCADEDSLALGAQCDLNSDCEAPLVCRLERCRNECTVSRDCPLGARCVVDNEGLGSCTLDREDDCTGAEDCPETLHCVVGACRNLCEGDDDCASDATCRPVEDRMACFAPGDVPDAGTPPMDASTTDGGEDAGPRDAATPDGGPPTGVVPCTTDPGLPACAGCTVIDISAGGAHVCAVRSDGRVFCWGRNDHGQLGVAGGASDVPVEVPGITTAVQVSAGVEHTCARLEDDTLRCWGSDAEGQLGDGSTDSTGPTPVTVSSIDGATDVSAGSQYTCAVAAGQAYCWGSDIAEQLGNGDGALDSDVPYLVDAIASTAQGVAASDTHACAVVDTGQVYCWGANNVGQLGRGAPSSGGEGVPAAVSGLTGASQVTTGSQGVTRGHGCARSGGDVRCWGYNDVGQLGTGSTDPSSSPTAVVLTDVADVSAGPSYTCAARSSGELWCWGGSLTGVTSGADTPERFGEVDAVMRVSAGGAGFNHHACAIVAGRAVCWGSNNDGRLGAGIATGMSTSIRAVCGL